MTSKSPARDRRLVTRSKRLSWLLRHGAHEVDLAMDEAGWAAIDDVLRIVHLSPAELDEIVRTNDKRRLQVDGQRIRACQGHSTKNAAITLDGLEASWARYAGDASLWHGTSVEAVASIAREGIVPVTRTHVHCTMSVTSNVGKRAQVAVLLEIDPQRLRGQGLDIFVAQNGVVLMRRVPPNCIVGLRPVTERAKAMRETLLTSLGLPT